MDKLPITYTVTIDREIDNKKREVEYLTKMLENAKRDLRNLEWKKKNQLGPGDDEDDDEDDADFDDF